MCSTCISIYKDRAFSESLLYGFTNCCLLFFQTVQSVHNFKVVHHVCFTKSTTCCSSCPVFRLLFFSTSIDVTKNEFKSKLLNDNRIKITYKFGLPLEETKFMSSWPTSPLRPTVEKERYASATTEVGKVFYECFSS